MKRNISNHKTEVPLVQPSKPMQAHHFKELDYIENNKRQHLKTKQHDKDDLDWLQQIVHQFEVYKDLKDSSLFKDNKQTVEKSYSVEGLLQKVGLNENLYRNSQRKLTQESKKNIPNRSKQIKHEVILKNLPIKTNILPGSAKSKRSESETTGFAKKKDPTRNTKQKAKFAETHKQMTETLKKNFDLVQFCGIRDMKADLVKMKNKLSMPETKNIPNKTNRAIVMKQNRKNLLQTMEQKSVGKIVKNKSIELKQRRATNQNDQNFYVEKNNPNEIQNFLSRSREKKQYKIQTNRQKEDQLNFNEFRSNSSERQVKEKKPLQERPLNIELILTETKNTKIKQIVQNNEILKQESKFVKENTRDIKNTQTKKFNYLSQKSLESRYEKICQMKQRKLNSSFGDRKIVQLTTLGHEQNSQKTLQPVIEAVELQNSHSPRTDEFKKKEEIRNESPTLGSKWPIPQSLWKLNSNVKLVESTKNSQVLTEHSIVIDKNQIIHEAKAEKESSSEDWNITQVFQMLDRKRLGFLNRDNCSIETIPREMRIILGVVLDEIMYKNIQYNFPQFIHRVQTTLDSIKDIHSLSLPPTHLIQQRFGTISSNQAKPALNSFPIKENTAGNKTYTNNKQEHKKYEYTKVFIQDICTEPNQKKRTDCNQTIRFATFQDEEIKTDTDQNYDLGSGEKVMNWNKEIPAIKPRDIQKLEIKLDGLTQFKSKYDHQSKHLSTMHEKYPSTNRTNTTSTFRKQESHTNLVKQEGKSRQRSYSETGKKDYRNEIVKLQMLNQRLQKYLHAQNMKQFSSSKLLIG